jgi:hypothetical protein
MGGEDGGKLRHGSSVWPRIEGRAARPGPPLTDDLRRMHDGARDGAPYLCAPSCTPASRATTGVR